MKTLVRAKFLLLLPVLCLVLAAPAVASYHTPLHIGVRCQNDFQYGWAPHVDLYSMCNQFIVQIHYTDFIDFYYNLQGGAPAFQYGNGQETCSGCGGVDSVDFFFLATHGFTDASGYVMWDYNSGAYLSSMRLGSSGKQVKVFATYACDTFRTYDGHFWDRWGNAFRGGLKIAVGGHDNLYDGNSQKGWEFAGRMQNGEAISQSWLEAVWYADNNNTPSAASTGTDANDCFTRLGMNLFVGYVPLRDGQIGSWCARGWNGV